MHITRVGVVPVLYILREVWEERFRDPVALSSVNARLLESKDAYLFHANPYGGGFKFI